MRGDCKATINANYTRHQAHGRRARRPPASPPAASRTASRSPPTAGSCTSAAATAAPTPSAARCSACRRSAASSTTPNPNVGIGCGSVHIFDPSQYTGVENSGVTRAGTLAVYGDGGQGGERTERGRPQDGVRPARHHAGAGLRRRPATSTCSTSRPSTRRARRPACRSSAADLEDVAPAHLALHDRPGRRSSSTSAPRSSIFEYDAQIYSCCHVGGGMGFDSEGNLYVTTGDTNSSQGTNGYSGNNPVAKCPTGPDDVPSRAALRRARTTATRTRAGRRATPTTTTARCCGSRRSPDIADGRRSRRSASARRTRCRPPTRPTARTCSTARGRRRPGQARDLRDGPAQPEPPLDRPEDRHAVHGLGRPGRRRPERDGGPVDVRERRADLARRQLRLAVLHGHQAGLPRPHRADGNPAHGQPGRLRARRSGHRRHRGLVRLRQPAQRLAQQHRPGRVPARDRHRADAGKVRGNNLWYSRGNPGSANGCPEFPRPRGADGRARTTAPPRRRAARTPATTA